MLGRSSSLTVETSTLSLLKRLKLSLYKGACTSCPSSSTTMTMGIERVLKEKFGDALKDIRQVFDEEVKHITVEVRVRLPF
ncbi:hypothetical protein N665_2164s0001 [Sinapis alba]|nr:hypothetical protein N665_2164s0001 [Sinapis alba]